MPEYKKNSVFVALYELFVTERTGDRSAKVLTTHSTNHDDLINIAVERRSDINASTFRAVLDILSDIALEELLNGASVTFGLGHFKLEAKGVFYGDHPAWDSTQHALVPHMTPTAKVREGVRNVTVEVLGMASSGIFINTVTDVATGELNGSLTPGGGINITGSKIKVAGDNPSVGIYLIGQTARAIIKLPATSILRNDPSYITCIVPAELSPDDYKVQITTQFTGSQNMLKEPRSYTFEYALHTPGYQIPDITDPPAPFE